MALNVEVFLLSPNSDVPTLLESPPIIRHMLILTLSVSLDIFNQVDVLK